MKVLVIIVTYNFERWLTPCLTSLRQSEQAITVMVIDNCSQDRTVDRIRSEYPEVRLIENKENLGFGRANNIGFHTALHEEFDYVFLLNQDAWIDRNTIGRLVEVSCQYPEYGILSPIHLTANRQHIDAGFPMQDLPSGQDDNAVYQIPFVNAAMWLIPCRVLKETGGFSPLFYHYGEDVDWANRLHYHGFKIGYCPVFGCHDREYRTVTKAMEYRGKSVYLLTVLADINLSFAKALLKSIGGGTRLILHSLLHGKWNDATFYIPFTSRLLYRSKQVYTIRRITRTKGKHFITDNI